MNKYTLRELSDELEISIEKLKKHISKGTLQVKKIGRNYWVSPEHMDKFMESVITFPARNYYCQYYDKCLDKAAIVNKSFDCEGCKRFRQAEKQILTSLELDGMASLWESVFGSPVSANC